MRRRFNAGERRALYLLSAGQCVACGEPLPTSWHADHRLPVAGGGLTELTNGQAMCPECNLRKGSRVEGFISWPLARELRKWQANAFRRWCEHLRPDFLMVATPGGGKTTAALRIGSHEMTIGNVERLVVVVPTDHLRRQWADAASPLGMELNPAWDNAGPDGPGFCGIVVTYHQVARSPDIHALLCRRRTLVIFDEVHHAGDGQAWGDALRIAYGPAVRRLLLSGTPFRSDSKAIPFVAYADGKCLADFDYTYGDALNEEVVRQVHFPNYEGSFEWRFRGEVVRAAFRDAIPEEQARRRLRTALDHEGEWLPTIIRQADAQLTEVRQLGHANAGALLVCIDQWHAKRVAAIVHKVTGEAPVIALSDDKDASGKIADFAGGRQRWLVAVRMVSEGVDIPRLRVGVYATNVITELYFRQVVGRFVRVSKGIDQVDQPAWLYLPADKTLVSYAFRIKEEADTHVDERAREIVREQERLATDDGVTTGEFVPGDASDATLVNVIVDGQSLPPAELEVARVLMAQVGIGRGHEARIALLLRLAGVKVVEGPPAILPDQAAPVPQYRLRKMLRAQVTRLVNKYVAQIGIKHDQVNRWLAKETGAWRDEASNEQLEQCIELLTKEMRSGGREQRAADS